MRRLIALISTLAAAALVAALLIGSSAQGDSSYKFAVVFDDARGLIGGQLVKIAGAEVGQISQVKLNDKFQAVIEGTIPSRFAFHQDATCTIRPQGLIAENFVECDPGSPNAAALVGQNGHPPMVPVTHTTEPVNLLDLFNIWNLPTRERLTVLVNELGIGTSGRGQDFNEILRRANPALALARQAIGILARQKAQLGSIIDATNTIAAEASNHTPALRNFLDRAAHVTTLVANHRDNLSSAIARLPGLLGAAQPALAQLDTVAVSGTPLVQQLHAAVPALNKVANDLGPFVTVAKPGLLQLGTALTKAIPAIRDTTPLLPVLRSYLSNSKDSSLLMGRLFKNLQQHGFVENFLNLFYYLAASAARFDATSHLIPTYIVAPPNPQCVFYATTPVAGCNWNFGQHPGYAPASASADHVARPATPRTGPPPAPAPAAASATSTATASTGAAPASPVSGVQQKVQQLLQKLLQNTGKVTGPALGRLQQLLSSSQAQSTQTLQNLVNYLLK
jgi:ABC-type transporter Mla subunit MlaD